MYEVADTYHDALCVSFYIVMLYCFVFLLYPVLPFLAFVICYKNLYVTIKMNRLTMQISAFFSPDTKDFGLIQKDADVQPPVSDIFD